MMGIHDAGNLVGWPMIAGLEKALGARVLHAKS